MFVPAPVSPGDIEQFDGVRVDLRCVLNMRTAAKVNEFAGFINGDRHFLVSRITVIIQVTAFQTFDQLQLIGLVFEKLFGICRRNLFTDEVRFSLDQLFHSVFNGFEIVRRKGTRKVEVVIKTVFDRWTDGNLPIREHFQDSFSHQVGS